MRLHVARIEHEFVVQLVPLADAHDIFLSRLDAEALVVGVVDHVDLVRLGVDEAEDVALRALGHSHHAGRTSCRKVDRRPRVGEREAVGQVLRKHQVNAIVNRDHRPAAHERRQDVMRRVKERHAFALERERNPQLLDDRIVSRGLGDRAEVVPEQRERFAVALAAEDDELGLAIEARQLPQQVRAACGHRCQSARHMIPGGSGGSRKPGGSTRPT